MDDGGIDPTIYASALDAEQLLSGYPWSSAAVGVFIGMSTALVASVIPALHSLRVGMSTVMRS